MWKEVQSKLNKHTESEEIEMMSSVSRIDTMIYEYNNVRRDNDIILLLTARR